MAQLPQAIVTLVTLLFALNDAQQNQQSGFRDFKLSSPPVQYPQGLWLSPQVPPRSRNPPVVSSKNFARDVLGVQSQQVLQGASKPLNWQFPVVPDVQQQAPPSVPLKTPVTPNSVAVQCQEDSVLVEVKQDFFGTGQLITPSGLSLGGCSAVGLDSAANVLIYQYPLQDCNSVLMMTEESLVYSFTLTYSPLSFSGTPITRTEEATVGIQCHYQRFHNVSSNILMPTWVPFSTTEFGVESLVFSLSLMADDWSGPRPSSLYFLGDVINVEASVMEYNHVALRVYIDSCVATQVPDVNSVPRYSFIENHGCLVDAKSTGSTSHFIPQSRPDKLRFQLEAFMFQQETSPSIYITCIIKATLASAPSDLESKSCSFTGQGWSAADGNDQVCGCCDSTCGSASGFGTVSGVAPGSGASVAASSSGLVAGGPSASGFVSGLSSGVAPAVGASSSGYGSVSGVGASRVGSARDVPSGVGSTVPGALWQTKSLFGPVVVQAPHKEKNVLIKSGLR